MRPDYAGLGMSQDFVHGLSVAGTYQLSRSSITRYCEKRVYLLFPMLVDNGHASPQMEYVAYWIVLAHGDRLGVHADEAENCSSSNKYGTTENGLVYPSVQYGADILMIQVKALEKP